MRGFFSAILGMALLLPPGALSTPVRKLDDASIRNFVAEQGRAWNARDFRRFYTAFAPDSAIVLFTTHRGKEVARRVRTPGEDRREAERFFAGTQAKIRETDQIERITIAPDGRHARLRVKELAHVRKHGHTKVIHAATEQELALRDGRIVVLQLMEFDGSSGADFGRTSRGTR
jgi:hypothetical protein